MLMILAVCFLSGSKQLRYGSCENTANLSILLKKIIQPQDRNMENFNPETKIQPDSSYQLEITCQVYLQLCSKLRKAYCQLPTYLNITGKAISAQQCTSQLHSYPNPRQRTALLKRQNKNGSKTWSRKEYMLAIAQLPLALPSQSQRKVK